jgi:hypothetical protein
MVRILMSKRVVEVSIRRENYCLPSLRLLNERGVVLAFQFRPPNVETIVPMVSEKIRGCLREILVEQELHPIAS